MTEIIVDREFSTEGTSSVIDYVFYSTDEKKLFVQLHSGDLAGYEGVPEDVYTALETINKNRLGGDEESSVGSYWNRYIKKYMPGFETAGVELITPDDEEAQESPSFFAHGQEYADEAEAIKLGAVTTPQATILPVDPPAQLVHFGVSFTSGEGKEVTLSVKATDVNDAVKRFHEATRVLGWDATTVTSVTQYFG